MTRKSDLKQIRLKRLKIANFKAIDAVELHFPQPRMKGDPDIHVMGSRNGLGKTSIFEACALLFLGMYGSGTFQLARYRMDLTELFVRSGSEEARIEGDFSVNGEDREVRIRWSRSDALKITSTIKINPMIAGREERPDESWVEQFLMLLAGYTMEPIVMQPCLYFHSYRKVQKGKPELGMMVESEMPRQMRGRRPGRWRGPYEEGKSVSTFKIKMLHAMMGTVGLFESLDKEQADKTREQLNRLIEKYAGGTIEKLRPSHDNTFVFLITPRLSGKTGPGDPFSFDGLSSGQKEIISTLFLIWHHTLDQSGIILIDEPELHLNTEWHRDFVRQIFELAPGNQYILATHSEDVFGSVDEDRRLFLE
ncbi:MAG: ATP-binding protein [Magnetococcales bacterium]|nr:ATP-binding protein [Magnetococcales bacterium]